MQKPIFPTSPLESVREGMTVIDELGRRHDALTRFQEAPTFTLAHIGPPAREVQSHLFPISDHDGKGRIGILLRDVTDERGLARTKDQLVSVVSHELRTPLASVVGFAELLRDREYAEPQRRQFLTVIIEEGRRLTALINDFLDLHRLESAGRQHLTLRSTALRPLVEQAILAAGADRERPIVLHVTEHLPLVRADADRLQQVLGNLLSNARKYSPSGGAVQLSASEAEGEVWISIRDEGLGVPPAALPHLFEKFYRVDNSDRRSIKGTGLGLAICKQIIEAHGGCIQVESAGLGRGSTFSFSLRKACPEPTVGDVLVVEDDAGFARLLDVELAEHGLSTVCVASAEQALTRVADGLSRLVVLDLMLPGLQGEVFLERLREVGAADVRVVVITAKDLSHEERAVLQELQVARVFRKGPGAARAAARFIADLVPAGVRRAA